MRPVSITLPEHHLSMLDEMRRAEPDVPNRSEIVRRLIDRQAAEHPIRRNREAASA